MWKRLRHPLPTIQSSEKQKISRPFSGNVNSLNADRSVWSKCNIADDRSQILTQLSLIEPKLSRQDIQDGPAQMQGNGSCKQSLEAGAPVVERFVAYTARRRGNCSCCVFLLSKMHLWMSLGHLVFLKSAQKEQSPTNMLGALLKLVVGALGERQGRIARAYEDQKKSHRWMRKSTFP